MSNNSRKLHLASYMHCSPTPLKPSTDMELYTLHNLSSMTWLFVIQAGDTAKIRVDTNIEVVSQIAEMLKKG